MEDVHPETVHGPGNVVVVADGEHYPTAVRDAIAEISANGLVVGAVALVGGSEKLRGEPDYGVPHHVGSSPAAALSAALDAVPGAVGVIDLADEPVLTFETRMELIAQAAGAGLAWMGADFSITPQQFATVPVPTLAITGTGKRIGKTAVSSHVARLADAALAGGGGGVVVVAMGRGGPAEPVVIDRTAGPVTVERLLEVSRAGAHAASDYLEDAALTGLTTIGCRRVGGGLLGAPVTSNVLDGALIAASRDPQLVILEGSGSCVPPVAADATILIASTARPRDLFSDLGAYRLARADLLLVIGDDPAEAADMVERARQLRPGLDAIAARLEPTAVTPVDGRRVAAFTTAPEHVLPIARASLERAGATVVLTSGNLARRDLLRTDVEHAIAAGADTFAVEIKAAGIDVVAEAAAANGIDVAFLDNPPVPHPGQRDLDAALTALATRTAAVAPA